MKKTFWAVAVLASASLVAHAGKSVTPIADKPKFSGYIIGQYQANFQANNSKTFNIRMARVACEGHIVHVFECKQQGLKNGKKARLDGVQHHRQ